MPPSNSDGFNKHKGGNRHKASYFSVGIRTGESHDLLFRVKGLGNEK